MENKIINFQGCEKNNLVGNLFGEDKAARVILFMHGGGQTRHSWKAAAHKLAKKNFATITIDARGHGESGWVKSQNYSLEFYAKDLIAIVKQIKKKWGVLPIIVGASMGGLSAMLALHFQKKLCSGLVLVDITPSPQKRGVEKIQKFMNENMKTGFASIEEAGESIGKYLTNRKKPKSLKGLAKNLKKINGRYYWHWDPALWNGKNPINRGEKKNEGLMWQACMKINFPCMLVRGTNSELVAQKQVKQFLKAVPNCEFIDIKDASHMVVGDRNTIFAKNLKTFIDGRLGH